MSRFFHGGLSDSDTSSSDEELYSEEEESEVEDHSSDSGSEDGTDEEEVSGDEAGGNRFLVGGGGSDDESDEDDGRRVVKSQKDKRMEEIEASAKLIENGEKINDWVLISAEFDKLNKIVSKPTETSAPKVYIKIIADLEDFMNETLKDKAAAKKMNAANARALNTIKQRLKRNNRGYEKEIEEYKKDPEAFMKEDKKPAAPKAISKVSKIVEPGQDSEDDRGFSTIGRSGKALTYTPESIFKHLRGIIEARGKKNTDKGEQIKVMERLYEVAQTPYQKIKVLLALISTRFDLTYGALSYMSAEQWKAAEKEFNTLLEVLEANPDYVVIENAEEWDDDEKQPVPAAGEVLKIPGSVVSFVDRLDDELTRSLQHIDPHTTEYIDRLSDEGALYTTILRNQLYLERLQRNQNIPTDEAINRVIMRRLEHLYFKPEQVISTVEENAWKSIPAGLDSAISAKKASTSASDLLYTLCTYLYKHDATVLRTRAMLCHIYHYALHNQFYKARDLMLMSHLQENIHVADVSTQILYNRTLVQVGLCAFRAGLIYEAQTCLQEICGTGRLKEMLAQGVQIQRYSQVSPEQERLERQRQLPFHQHINLELLECAYLTCSMLLEIPALAATGSSPDLKKRVISKTFRRMLEYHERQIFTGPAENTRDHVMQSAKALAAGEWKRSSELIHAIKIWDLLPEPQKIKDMLSEKIQEEGLRTYLFTYAPFYDTLSISRLVEMFDLSERKVSALVSKMIAHEEIAAALDQVNNAIIFRKGVELSRLQTLALTLSDKASSLMEMNERVLEQKTQGQGGFPEGGQGGRGGGRGGRGGRRGDHEGGRGGRGGGQGRGRGNKNVQFNQQSGFHGGAMRT
ncbi:uncharacterized protein LAJ45_02024 [Morchella importuna]|uniref:Eukaryotic translation initiation factor 3 subunit C n=1 Tax=Morchella conica CCBAS932 TaxID=1392247 RepID=A0A3N4L8M3_9PEZI|nr:uncharacterized protein LAJ45_02024 [Morchella importuna]KAH8154256.1 hypothetical protein LAJ45_02024 [Morchella importuna]RPB16981.1 hypothetical protein P167DRAFT_531925 [Morchella conica CCBAS932]